MQVHTVSSEFYACMKRTRMHRTTYMTHLVHDWAAFKLHAAFGLVDIYSAIYVCIYDIV